MIRTGWGLSPRVRGNPLSQRPRPVCQRSIPARAGEPLACPVSGWPRRVYPRACGGTYSASVSQPSVHGLSPRVRGNLSDAYSSGSGVGSIPARAGEPDGYIPAEYLTKVYPRACGGTHLTADGPSMLGGLSPRVRGNPGIDGHRVPRVGSIPARAGEPAFCSARHSMGRVYPRACGGTNLVSAIVTSYLGLSPRVRGNLRLSGSLSQRSRSIPARAGEPSPCGISLIFTLVYPRACGGTEPSLRRGAHLWGLSPRVRGNRNNRQLTHSPGRSIPARAGEPKLPLQSSHCQSVYPRACGGTPLWLAGAGR